MTILITGVTGFLGSSLASFLHSNGHDVIGLSSSLSGFSSSSCKYPVILVDYSNLESVFLKHRPKVVINLAGFAHQKFSRPLREFNCKHDLVNHILVRKLIDSSSLLPSPPFLIHVSSISVYGSFCSSAFQGFRLSENTPASPYDSYSLSKFLGEASILNSDIRGLIVRLPLVYGPGAPGNYSRLVRLCQSLPLIPFRNLDTNRTLLYLGNFLDAMRAIVELDPYKFSLLKSIYCLSDPFDVSVSDLIASIIDHHFSRRRRLFCFPRFCLKFIASIICSSGSYEKLAFGPLVDSRLFTEDFQYKFPYSSLDDIHDF